MIWAKGFTPHGADWVCNDCSAVVASREDHSDWHHRLVECLKIAVDA